MRLGCALLSAGRRCWPNQCRKQAHRDEPAALLAAGPAHLGAPFSANGAAAPAAAAASARGGRTRAKRAACRAAPAVSAWPDAVCARRGVCCTLVPGQQMGDGACACISCLEAARRAAMGDAREIFRFAQQT